MDGLRVGTSGLGLGGDLVGDGDDAVGLGGDEGVEVEVVGLAPVIQGADMVLAPALRLMTSGLAFAGGEVDALTIPREGSPPLAAAATVVKAGLLDREGAGGGGFLLTLGFPSELGRSGSAGGERPSGGGPLRSRDARGTGVAREAPDPGLAGRAAGSCMLVAGVTSSVGERRGRAGAFRVGYVVGMEAVAGEGEVNVDDGEGTGRWWRCGLAWRRGETVDGMTIGRGWFCVAGWTRWDSRTRRGDRLSSYWFVCRSVR